MRNFSLANQYFIQQNFSLDPIKVDETTSHHIFHVMRMREADKLEVAFSDGRVALAQIISPEQSQIQVLEEIQRNNELPIQVTIALGFPKGDKLDFIVEKSTELGAVSIQAAPFDWSVVKWNKEKLKKKQVKLAKIAQGAAEQSKRNLIPEVILFDKFEDLLKTFSEYDQVLVAYEESAKAGESAQLVQSLAENPEKLLIIFGPEGGISPEEIEKMTNSGAKLAGLGPRILRAETAPLYALSAISALRELK